MMVDLLGVQEVLDSKGLRTCVCVSFWPESYLDL
jgi:hypothetical protein